MLLKKKNRSYHIFLLTSTLIFTHFFFGVYSTLAGFNIIYQSFCYFLWRFCLIAAYAVKAYI